MVHKYVFYILAVCVDLQAQALRVTSEPSRFEIGTPGEEGGGTPKLFFLFMVRDSLPHAKIWARFLANAREGIDYEALVHCVEKQSCMQSIKPLFSFDIIETADSEYCKDLVSPMNALLASALGRGEKNKDDKFVFLSESTVPVKPFANVQFELTIERATTSDFCITPKSEWAHNNVKHHQWIVLHRSHALKAVSVKINDFQSKGLNGCLDEYFHFLQCLVRHCT
jgi:hypothetical protein